MIMPPWRARRSTPGRTPRPAGSDPDRGPDCDQPNGQRSLRLDGGQWRRPQPESLTYSRCGRTWMPVPIAEPTREASDPRTADVRAIFVTYPERMAETGPAWLFWVAFSFFTATLLLGLYVLASGRPLPTRPFPKPRHTKWTPGQRRLWALASVSISLSGTIQTGLRLLDLPHALRGPAAVLAVVLFAAGAATGILVYRRASSSFLAGST